MIVKIKSFFLSLLNWIVIPALVVYGYYYGNEASVFIVLFYMWIMFFIMSIITVLIGITINNDGITLDKDTINDSKKLKAYMKWGKKLKGKWFSFKMSVSTFLYIGLSIVIAASGAIWTAFVFIIIFVVIKYILVLCSEHW